MNDEKLFSSEQLTAILDNDPVAIYVTAADDLELLYFNRRAEKMLVGKNIGPGVKCYEAAGFDRPCPFCQVKNMHGEELLVREFRHPRNGRIYQISGKIIDWAGRLAHIEYILDITEKKKEQEKTQSLKEELETTFRSIPCGLCVYRYADGEISPLYHNPAFYKIMGYSADNIEKVEQKTDFLGVCPDDLPELRKKIFAAVTTNGEVGHTYRLWDDAQGEYKWIRLDSAVKEQDDGTKLLYGVYSDVSKQQRLEKELTAANENMQNIVNAIPGGVAIYKITDKYEAVYFSDGVRELSGYSPEEYNRLIRGGAEKLIYSEDVTAVAAKLTEAIVRHTVVDLEFRKVHKDGHLVWVHAQAQQVGEEDGCPLVQCVFHNISELKNTQLELAHLVNSIPGGIASYRVTRDEFIPAFVSGGVTALLGYERDEYEKMGPIYEPDRERVENAVKGALASGESLDVSYRMRAKDGKLVWIHMSGRRMGPPADVMWFYAVFTGMSSEAQLFRDIANETADGIYVIDKQSYELLYANESKELFGNGPHLPGQKCYEALHGKNAPCEFCSLQTQAADGREHEFAMGGTDKTYTSRFIETDWNGIPAYVQYIRDVTAEVRTRLEKERLEIYFQTVMKNLPGGISVCRFNADGSMSPEFISDGFAALTHMTVAEATELYKNDFFAGVHPDDVRANKATLQSYFAGGEGNLELVGRLRCGNSGYVWVKSTLSIIRSGDGVRRVYSSYADISDAMREREALRRSYDDLLLRHYRMQGPNVLILGHCNITQNRIFEIEDHTDSDLLSTFGYVREEFFKGVASLIVDEGERQAFLGMYLNAPALAAFNAKQTECILDCYVKLPKEEKGRYVRFNVNLVATPDNGDVAGILTVTDVTEQTIADRIMHQLSVNSYDYIADLNLDADTYRVLVHNKNACCVPPEHGCHTARVAEMIRDHIVPRDRESYDAALDTAAIRRRLAAEGSYTFSYSLVDETGGFRTKNTTISAVDLRLGRVCLSCSDITESVRGQQGLLNMIAYTFELACFIDVDAQRLTMYTREAIIEKLPPYIIENYDREVPKFTELYGAGEDNADAEKQFSVATMKRRLTEKPQGYDFVFRYQAPDEVRYKQINVLWGDENHKTICIVRADVTDMLVSERETKAMLEKALVGAEEASRAKSDFLSSMSHDIRTPMNAITGMTTIALANLDDKKRVEDCLRKISVSSKHLLSLINDVLDMSKLDRSKITLNRVKISVGELVEQLATIMEPQAKAAGSELEIQTINIRHGVFYGDALRINQILINILSNAVKFTPAGGKITFAVEECTAKGESGRASYRFTVADTGIGMPKEFVKNAFAPFARSRAAENIEGTGLGLSITKGLVDLMGGRISVKSAIGKGTVFKVELRFDAGAEDIAVAAGEKPGACGSECSAFAGRRFLIAEDNAINAEILGELLAMNGSASDVATDGVRAVRAFSDAAPGTYDAILMDVQMPEMNGYEATRAIRKMHRADAQTIPIIAMTANAFTEDIKAALAAGMTAHVAKPIDMKLLESTLEKALCE